MHGWKLTMVGERSSSVGALGSVRLEGVYHA